MLEAGIAINNENLQRVRAGESGYDCYKGFAEFNSTDATMNLPVPFRRIKGFSHTWVGTPAPDEVLSLDHAADVTSDGHEIQLVAGSDGSYVLKIKRTGASKTSGLIFAFNIHGLG